MDFLACMDCLAIMDFLAGKECRTILKRKYYTVSSADPFPETNFAENRCPVYAHISFSPTKLHLSRSLSSRGSSLALG